MGENATIYLTDLYEVIIHGNGWAYTLKKGNQKVQLQDLEARAFEGMFNAAENLPRSRVLQMQRAVIDLLALDLTYDRRVHHEN